MKQRSPFLLALAGLLLSSACRESKPLPPGNWTGRCKPSPDAKESASYGPPPTSFVSDKAELFEGPFHAELQRMLSAFQKESCHQLMVVTVPSLEGTTLEEHALTYANRVGLGYRGLNNGVMLLVAPKARKARIQIGCGLEDVISDAQATDIMERELSPAIQADNYEQGIRSSIGALMVLASKKTIAREFRPEGCL